MELTIDFTYIQIQQMDHCKILILLKLLLLKFCVLAGQLLYSKINDDNRSK
jgi:hypothetical protein